MSRAKQQPKYIPNSIVEDYTEACRMLDLSPKASATMARRCMQGIIRDFCGITKLTLSAEINELRRQVKKNQAPKTVAPDTIGAIDTIRGFGNIRAHMKKSVDLIIDVEPDEARMLIGLIEFLFNERYVARETRRVSKKELEDLASKKAEERKGAASANASDSPATD